MGLICKQKSNILFVENRNKKIHGRRESSSSFHSSFHAVVNRLVKNGHEEVGVVRRDAHGRFDPEGLEGLEEQKRGRMRTCRWRTRVTAGTAGWIRAFRKGGAVVQGPAAAMLKWNRGNWFMDLPGVRWWF